MSGSNNSEVARLMAQIANEYEAGRQGLTGLTYGMSQHEFISARMEKMGQLHEQLGEMVGQDTAIEMIVTQIEMSQNKSPRNKLP